MKLVMQSKATLRAGDVVTMQTDHMGAPIQQPVCVVREATREEFVAALRAFGWDPTRNPTIVRDLFYEVVTD